MCVCVCVCVCVRTCICMHALSCVHLFSTLLDCGPLDYSIHGILQTKILKWVDISSSRGYSRLRDPNPCLLHYRQILYRLSHLVLYIFLTFIFLDFKITADGDCNHEIKRHLLLGRKVMTNLDSILKSRDITLPTKVCLVKAMVFPVVMYGCESWTIKLSTEELMLLNCGVGEDS